MLMFRWNEEKNQWLKLIRNISFNDIISAIERDKLIATADHFNQKRYPGQKLYYVEIAGYMYIVPFVQHGNIIFLKTIYPTRKATRLLLKGKHEKI